MENKIDEKIHDLELVNLELIEFLKNRIFNFFNNKNNVNNFSISGGWGTGKTEIFKKLEKHINETEKERNIKFIWISLWNYEWLNENKIFIKIISEILKEMSILIKNNQSKFKNWKKSSGKFLKKLASAINVSFSIPFLKSFGIDIDFDVKKFKKELESEEDFRNDIKDLIDDFENMVSSLNTEIILIFDDLDRCQENKILNILTTIKNFFFQTTSRKIFYLVSLNEEYVNAVLQCQTDGEKYTEKIFLKENKVEINEIIKYDWTIKLFSLSEQIEEKNDSALIDVFEKLKIFDEVINRHLMNVFDISFRNANSKIEFIYDINFLEQMKNKSENEIIDEIFLELFKRDNFLKWKKFQARLIENGFQFIEKFLWEKKLIPEDIIETQKRDYQYKDKRYVDQFKYLNLKKFYSYNLESFTNSSGPYKNFFYVNIDSKWSLNFYDFVCFLNTDINFEDFWKKMESEKQERANNITLFWFDFEDLIPFLDKYFLTYILTKIKIWDIINYDIGQRYKELNLIQKIKLEEYSK